MIGQRSGNSSSGRKGQWRRGQPARRSPPALFGLLDGVTIARSRKHVEQHYAASMERIGSFPKRTLPYRSSPISTLGAASQRSRKWTRRSASWNLALYSPLKFVLFQHQPLYDKGGNFDQANREKYLIAMMKSGFLKRLESSVNSFGVTMDRMIERIDRRVHELDAFDEAASIEAALNGEDDLDEELEEAFEVGGALKYRLVHIDRAGWKAALLRDRERIGGLADAARQVTPERDAKLEKLIEIVHAKRRDPRATGMARPIARSSCSRRTPTPRAICTNSSCRSRRN